MDIRCENSHVLALSSSSPLLLSMVSVLLQQRIAMSPDLIRIFASLGLVVRAIGIPGRLVSLRFLILHAFSFLEFLLVLFANFVVLRIVGVSFLVLLDYLLLFTLDLGLDSFLLLLLFLAIQVCLSLCLLVFFLLLTAFHFLAYVLRGLYSCVIGYPLVYFLFFSDLRHLPFRQIPRIILLFGIQFEVLFDILVHFLKQLFPHLRILFDLLIISLYFLPSFILFPELRKRIILLNGIPKARLRSPIVRSLAFLDDLFRSDIDCI